MSNTSDNTLSVSEIKLGLNIAKSVYKLATTDAPHIVELKNSLQKVDDVLKRGDSEKILDCNAELAAKHPNVFSSPFGRYSFNKTTKEELLKRTEYERFCTLRSMGYALKDALTFNKAIEGLTETVKVGAEYYFDKQLEKILK